MKLSQKISSETDQAIPRCWITDCKYTVACCGIGENKMYQITAPMGRAPFAYTPSKAEVRKIIKIHKSSQL